jgi:hypothetical protein
MKRLIAQLTIVLGLLACLTWQVLQLWSPTLATDSPLRTSPGGATAVSEQHQVIEVPPTTLGDFQQTTARPLFIEGRRPPELKLAVVTPSVPQIVTQSPIAVAVALDQWRLVGVLIDTKRRRALIETPERNRVWLSIGETAGEWTLASVTNQKAELVAGARRGELLLYPATAN